jgi:hypothetical protein
MPADGLIFKKLFMIDRRFGDGRLACVDSAVAICGCLDSSPAATPVRHSDNPKDRLPAIPCLLIKPRIRDLSTLVSSIEVCWYNLSGRDCAMNAEFRIRFHNFHDPPFPERHRKDKEPIFKEWHFFGTSSKATDTGAVCLCRFE